MQPENRNPVEMAGQRINVYGFLARVYRSEIVPGFLGQIKSPQIKGALSALGA